MSEGDKQGDCTREDDNAHVKNDDTHGGKSIISIRPIGTNMDPNPLVGMSGVDIGFCAS